MNKRKRGEEEALIILKQVGIEIDEDYYDDNSKSKMPDLRYKDGRFIEVTHTRHVDWNIRSIKKYGCQNNNSPDINEVCQKLESVNGSFDRIINDEYDRDSNGCLTNKSTEEITRDRKIIKKHYGEVPPFNSGENNDFEFKADCPIIVHSTDNIIREIIEDKGKKYHLGDTDLFLFVTADEYRNMLDLISQWKWNGTANLFLFDIEKSPFPTIYICEWYFENNKYNIDNPNMLRFYKQNGHLQWECIL